MCGEAGNVQLDDLVGGDAVVVPGNRVSGRPMLAPSS
jgi:hypothetical protein